MADQQVKCATESPDGDVAVTMEPFLDRVKKLLQFFETQEQADDALDRLEETACHVDE